MMHGTSSWGGDVSATCGCCRDVSQEAARESVGARHLLARPGDGTSERPQRGDRMDRHASTTRFWRRPLTARSLSAQRIRYQRGACKGMTALSFWTAEVRV